MSKITINQDSLKTSREWKRHTVKEGSNVYRILPPFGDVSVHNNYPYRKWSIAWLVDPRTGKRRPFASPLTDGEEACPVKEYQDALKAFVEKKKSTLEAQGLSKQQVKEALKGLYDVQWNIKVQHLYAYNACDKSGNVGLLEIKSTAQKALKKKMAEYIALYGQDPTSLGAAQDDSGVWFNFTKEGFGKDTTYGVDFNMDRFKDEATGRLMSAEDRSPLAPNVVEGYENLGYDLNTVYYRKKYNDLRDILLYNLQLIADEVPEAILPGFEISGAAPVQAQPEAQAAVAPTKSTKPVNLNLGDDDDDDEAPFATQAAPAPVATAAAAATTMSDTDLDDIKDLADSVLGD
jgi:hypothetical protein